MRSYYDERAPEYDELYTDGGGPASISSPSAYKKDVAALAKVVTAQLRGDVLDLACGTAFWMQFYHRTCASITLVDHSPQMIAEADSRIRSLGLESKASTVRSDVFEFNSVGRTYDAILAGFLLSHLHDDEEKRLFKLADKVLRPNGVFVILDSVWSEERAATREKVGTLTRYLNDGRDFLIYKRYFERSDLELLCRRNGMQSDVAYFGRTFAAVCATR